MHEFQGSIVEDDSSQPDWLESDPELPPCPQPCLRPQVSKDLCAHITNSCKVINVAVGQQQGATSEQDEDISVIQDKDWFAGPRQDHFITAWRITLSPRYAPFAYEDQLQRWMMMEPQPRESSDLVVGANLPDCEEPLLEVTGGTGDPLEHELTRFQSDSDLLDRGNDRSTRFGTRVASDQSKPQPSTDNAVDLEEPGDNAGYTTKETAGPQPAPAEQVQQALNPTPQEGAILFDGTPIHPNRVLEGLDALHTRRKRYMASRQASGEASKRSGEWMKFGDCSMTPNWSQNILDDHNATPNAMQTPPQTSNPLWSPPSNTSYATAKDDEVSMIRTERSPDVHMAASNIASNTAQGFTTSVAPGSQNIYGPSLAPLAGGFSKLSISFKNGRFVARRSTAATELKTSHHVERRSSTAMATDNEVAAIGSESQAVNNKKEIIQAVTSVVSTNEHRRDGSSSRTAQSQSFSESIPQFDQGNLPPRSDLTAEEDAALSEPIDAIVDAPAGYKHSIPSATAADVTPRAAYRLEMERESPTPNKATTKTLHRLANVSPNSTRLSCKTCRKIYSKKAYLDKHELKCENMEPRGKTKLSLTDLKPSKKQFSIPSTTPSLIRSQRSYTSGPSQTPTATGVRRDLLEIRRTYLARIEAEAQRRNKFTKSKGLNLPKAREKDGGDESEDGDEDEGKFRENQKGSEGKGLPRVRRRLFSDKIAASSPTAQNSFDPFEDIRASQKHVSTRQAYHDTSPVNSPKGVTTPLIYNDFSPVNSPSRDTASGKIFNLTMSFTNKKICAVAYGKLVHAIFYDAGRRLNGVKVGESYGSGSIFEFKVTSTKEANLVWIIKDLFPGMVYEHRGEKGWFAVTEAADVKAMTPDPASMKQEIGVPVVRKAAAATEIPAKYRGRKRKFEPGDYEPRRSSRHSSAGLKVATEMSNDESQGRNIVKRKRSSSRLAELGTFVELRAPSSVSVSVSNKKRKASK